MASNTEKVSISWRHHEKQVSNTWTSNYIPQYLWHVITCPCPQTCLWHNATDMKRWHKKNLLFYTGNLANHIGILVTHSSETHLQSHFLITTHVANLRIFRILRFKHWFLINRYELKGDYVSKKDITIWCQLSFAKYQALHWRHNELDGVSNHRRLCCLLNRLLRRISKKTSKLRVTGLVTGEFPPQRASNAENASIWWRHHGRAYCKAMSHEVVELSDPWFTKSVFAKLETRHYLKSLGLSMSITAFKNIMLDDKILCSSLCIQLIEADLRVYE